MSRTAAEIPVLNHLGPHYDVQNRNRPITANCLLTVNGDIDKKLESLLMLLQTAKTTECTV
jgi:hypothetical protein